jgi:L-arabinose isomerase
MKSNSAQLQVLLSEKEDSDKRIRMVIWMHTIKYMSDTVFNLTKIAITINF